MSLTSNHLYMVDQQKQLERICNRDTAARTGNGLLPANPLDEPATRCSECNAPEPEGFVHDFGIGWYDGMGGGFDQKLAYVSRCCESDILDHKGRVVEAPERDYDV